MPTVGLVGVGLIGRAWANVFSRSGWDVRIWDPEPKALAAAPALIAQSLQDVARHGLAKDPVAAAKRVRSAASLEDAVQGTELVIESGPERVEVKIDLFQKLDAAAPAGAIIASSSSAIVASRFTEKLKGRHRCLVAHPVNPPHVVPIVELSGAPWTSPETVERARQYYDSVGQVPIVVKKEIDGFILNRMQAVLLSEAMRLVGEGYVSAEDLDKTIRDGLGLQVVLHGAVRDHRAQRAGRHPRLLRALRRGVRGAGLPAGDARAVGQGQHRPGSRELGPLSLAAADPRQAALARRAPRRAGRAQEKSATIEVALRCHPGPCARDPAIILLRRKPNVGSRRQAPG